MRVIEISQFGPPEVLQLAERPMPVPGPGEVLIKVAAAGVNRPDVIQRYGKYPPPPGASDIPGLEVAGHIAGAGAGVVQWREGDAVCALLAGGGYAEYCVAPQSQCLRAARDGCRWSKPRRCPRRSSPCGPTCSSAGGCRRGETHSDSRRVERDRDDRDPVGTRVRRAGVRDRGQRRQMRRPAWRSARSRR